MSDSVQITILGSCSGTEPMPGRHHTSFVMECGGRLFWFDAGENCSYAAHLGGIDLGATEAIFISHTHMDHIGGLPNLLWTMNKLTGGSPVCRERLAGRAIDVFIPDLAIFDAIRTVLAGTEGGFRSVFSLDAHLCADGVLYDRHGVRVIALHNRHLGASAPWRSFSFRIECGAKSLVYSGDVKSLSDFESIMEPCDLLLMETGHHKVDEICRSLQDSGKRFGKLVFMHHGRAILNDPAGELRKAEAILPGRVCIADDGAKLAL